jgi:hypothetical protein
MARIGRDGENAGHRELQRRIVIFYELVWLASDGMER